MFKAQVNNTIIENKTLSNAAFYLYTYLVIHARGDKKVDIYINQLLADMHWKSNKTLKKHLTRLKELRYIGYELGVSSKGYEYLPIHGSLTVYLNDNFINRQFTQVAIETLYGVRDATLLTEIHTMIDGELVVKSVYDEKELATRLYYMYEKSYNKKDNYSVPLTYVDIYSITKGSNKVVKAVSNALVKSKLLIVFIGERIIGSNKRRANKYLPTWKRGREFKTEPISKEKKIKGKIGKKIGKGMRGI